VSVPSRARRAAAKIFGALAAVLALALPAFAGPPAEPEAEADPLRETLVITGSREPQPLGGFPGSVEVVTREELEAYPFDSLAEVLRQRVGLHVEQPSTRGSRASVFTRGLDPNHTLVLLDGVVVNDPTNARGGSFDFSTLDVGGIERIEIARGPLSAVYGSDAIAGVIHIRTRGGKGPDRAELDVSGGRFGAVRVQGAASGERGLFDLAVGGSYQDDGRPDDLGDYRGAHGHASLGADLGGGTRLRVVTRFGGARDEAYPEFSGGDDLAEIRELERRDIDDLAGGVTLEATPAPWLDASFVASTYQRWEDRRSPGVAPSDGDSFGIPAEPDSEDRLRRYDLSAQATLHLPQDVSFAFGAEVEWERGESDATLVFFDPMLPPTPSGFRLDRRQGGPFAELRWSAPGGAVLLAGLRGDYSDEGDEEWSPRVAASMPLSRLGLELHGSWGEGFKLPSFFALGNPVVGNPGLEAEESRGWDAGVRGRFLDARLEPSVTWFDMRVDDLIDFDLDTFRLQNLERVRSRGVELEIRGRPHPDLAIRAHATWTHTRDRDDRRLRNRPEWRGGVELDWSPLERLRLRLQGVFVDEVRDASVPTAPGVVELDPWMRFDLALEWSVTGWMEVYAAVDNLFDADYEEAVGFPSVPIRPRAGVRLRY